MIPPIPFLLGPTRPCMPVSGCSTSSSAGVGVRCQLGCLISQYTLEIMTLYHDPRPWAMIELHQEAIKAQG